MLHLFHLLGALRTALGLASIALAGTAPFVGHRAAFSGWTIYPNLIAPSLTVIVSTVLALDITMSRLFMKEHAGAARRRFRAIAWIEAGLLAVLVLAWTPLAVRLIQP